MAGPATELDLRALAGKRSVNLFNVGLRRLPEALGSLRAVESLALDYEPVVELPRSIGKLTKLRELSASYTESLRTLPTSIGKLARLEKLVLHNSALRAVPKELWQCTSLRSLWLPEGVEKLPPGISKLTHLRDLGLSPRALTSIAKELPALRELRSIRVSVSGESRTLPDELGDVPSLTKLEAAFIGLARLPAGLVRARKLTELDVSGNALRSIIDTVHALPRLKKLDFSDNALSMKEKRALQAWMKLPPGKRTATSANASPQTVTKRTKPESLGTVASVNAFLALVVADARIAAAWTGTGDGDEPGGDWARASKAIERRPSAPMTIGSGRGMIVSFKLGNGFAHVYRVGTRVTFAEVFCENLRDPLFLEWIADEAPKNAKHVGFLDISSGKLAMMSITDTLKDPDSLTFAIGRGKWRVLLEPETNGAWGRGRRAHLVRA